MLGSAELSCVLDGNSVSPRKVLQMNDSEAEAVHALNGSTGTLPASAQLDLGFAERRQSGLAGVEEGALPGRIVERARRVVSFEPTGSQRTPSRRPPALAPAPDPPSP